MVPDNDPLKRYAEVPHGKSSPAAYKQLLPRELIMAHLDEAHRQRVVQEHPFSWGMDYYSMELAAGEAHTVTVTRNLGFNKSIVQLEGLELEQPNISYHWQMGLTPVLDYYFLTPNTGLRSINETIKTLTNKEVLLYFYDPVVAFDVTPQCVTLKRENGQQYFVVLMHNPKTLADVVGMVHELGHIADEEKNGHIYDKMWENLQFNNDWNDAVDRYYRTIDSWGDRDATAEELAELNSNYYSSRGYKNHQAIIIQQELNTWQAARELIYKLDLAHVIDIESEDFNDFMWWSIKTRIPYPEEYEGRS